jgi:hypothetical protein
MRSKGWMSIVIAAMFISLFLNNASASLSREDIEIEGIRSSYEQQDDGYAVINFTVRISGDQLEVADFPLQVAVRDEAQMAIEVYGLEETEFTKANGGYEDYEGQFGFQTNGTGRVTFYVMVKSGMEIVRMDQYTVTVEEGNGGSTPTWSILLLAIVVIVAVLVSIVAFITRGRKVQGHEEEQGQE